MPLRLNTLRVNTIANFAGQIWAFLLWLAVTPFYLRVVGADGYGLIGFFVVLQAAVAVLDFGMAGTLNRELARGAAGTPEPAAMANLLRCLQRVYGPLCVLIAAALTGFSGWIADHWLQSAASADPHLERALRWMGLAVALQFPIVFYSAGLAGLQRQLLLNGLNSSLTTLRQVGVFAPLALVAPTPEVFFTWQAATGALHSAVLAWALWRCLPRPRPPRTGPAPPLDFSALRQGLGFTGSLAAVGLLTFLLTQTDRVLLSRLLPLADFGRYMLAATLAYGINRLAAPISIAVQPRFSELVAVGQIERLKKFYHTSNQVVAVAIVPATVVLAVFASDVLRLWTGSDEVAVQAAPVLSLLGAGYGINATMTLAWALQVAYGRTRFGLVQSVVSVLLAVPSIAWAASRFGAVGAASVWLLLNLGYLAVTMPLIHRRILRGELAAWYLRDVAPVAIASTIVAALLAAALGPLARGAAGLAQLALVSALTLAAGALASGFVRSQLRALWMHATSPRSDPAP
jgi:O-antigen/teichoic acid export membrane protein